MSMPIFTEPLLRTKRPLTLPIGILANVPTVLNERGFNGWAIMQMFGLSPASFVRPLTPVPSTLFGHVLHYAVQETRQEDLPLAIGARARLENIGPLRMLISTSKTVGEALDYLVRYRNLWYSGLRVHQMVEGQVARLIMDVPQAFEGRAHLCFAFLTAMKQHLKAIVGDSWRCLAIHLAHPAPALLEKARYNAMFVQYCRQAPIWGEVHDAIVFPVELLSQPLTRHDAALNAYLRQQIQKIAHTFDTNLADQVGELVETLIIGGACTMDKVCAIMNVHRNTLHRQLKAYHTTFEDIVDHKRQTLANTLMARPELSLTDIAGALGYCAPSAFTRAYHRWYGVSPRIHRHSLVKTEALEAR